MPAAIHTLISTAILTAILSITPQDGVPAGGET